MKKLTNIFLWIYQYIIKTIFDALGIRGGSTCKFHPTCSIYTKQAFEKYGFFKGFWKSLGRILRCHPWSKGGVDLP